MKPFKDWWRALSPHVGPGLLLAMAFCLVGLTAPDAMAAPAGAATMDPRNPSVS